MGRSIILNEWVLERSLIASDDKGNQKLQLHHASAESLAVVTIKTANVLGIRRLPFQMNQKLHPYVPY